MPTSVGHVCDKERNNCRAKPLRHWGCLLLKHNPTYPFCCGIQPGIKNYFKSTFLELRYIDHLINT